MECAQHVEHVERAQLVNSDNSNQMLAEPEFGDTLSSLDRGEKGVGVRRSATFSGRRRVSIELCEFGVLFWDFANFMGSCSLFMIVKYLFTVY